MQPRKKLNVLLDLDETIVYGHDVNTFPFHKPGMEKKALNFPIYNMDGEFILFERPYLQQFLTYLFKNYNVSVWSAATKDYVAYIVKHVILGRKGRKLDFVFYSDHCSISKQYYNTTKQLNTLWEVFKIPGFNEYNTIIIDDLKKVYDSQPCNCIRVPPFSVLRKNSENDQTLLKVIDKLEIIKRNLLSASGPICLTNFAKKL